MTTLNFALIGLGKWGKKIRYTLESINGINLKYLYSPHQDEKQDFNKKKYNIIKNMQQLYRLSDVNGVVIATPPLTHFKIASELIKRDFNLFIEKPLVCNYKEAEKLVKLHKGRKSICMVGYIDIFNSGFEYALKKVNEIGKINYFSFEGGNLNLSDDKISALWDWGSHGVSLVLKLLKSFPTGINAWSYKVSGLDEIVHLRLVFKDKIEADIKVGWLFQNKKRELKIIGSNGSIEYDDFKKEISILNFKDSKKNKKHSFFNQNPLENELIEFKSSIIKNYQPETDLKYALKVTKILHIAEKSIYQKGKYIQVE